MHDWLRKHDRYVPRSDMSAAKRKQLRECFKALDVDGGGTVDKAELALVVQQLGLDAELAEQLLSEGDKDGDGTLSFEEFLTLIAKLSAMAQESDAGVSLNTIVERAASFPLSVVANSRYIGKLVDGYNPALLDEMTGEVRAQVSPSKAGAAQVVPTWRAAAGAASVPNRMALLRRKSKKLLDALTGSAEPQRQGDSPQKGSPARRAGVSRSPKPSEQARQQSPPLEASAVERSLVTGQRAPPSPESSKPVTKPTLLRRVSSLLRKG